MPSRAALRRHPATWWVGLAVTAVSAVVVARAVDREALLAAGRAIRGNPVAAVVALVVYGLAFVVRAGIWRRVLPRLGFGHALAALHVSLLGNHVLPLRLGEPLRVTSVVRRAGVPLDVATASTVTLRAMDLVAVAGLALLTGAQVVGHLTGRGLPVVVLLALAGAAVGAVWLTRLVRSGASLRLPGPLVAGGTVLTWVLESAVIWQAAHWAGIPLSAREAVLVTSVTIAAQAVAIAPGGFGTYEAAATAALVGVGADPGVALAVALTAHALKTAYALVTGAVAVVRPAPGLLGRLRLPATASRELVPPPAAGPVYLVLPAHDEEATVAGVVGRAPAAVRGRPVHVLVVDDGSSDATSERALAAGAEVVRFPENRGLGAAVGRGLAEAVARGATAVAFCDADGEYAPEELERMVGPVLDGDADYVAGSRFAGRIDRMLPHRRLGNRVLTALLRWVSRHPVTDGQSGYRALSREAARRAEIVHDFNYAQVLTLDLLAKGFRYAEVPISYRFRETGTSFVRLGSYLRAVVPAVHRELNTV